LCHTTDYSHHQIGVGFFDMFEIPQMRHNPLLCVVAHRASIEQDYIRILALSTN
jgi:hypothetical protein